MFCGPRNIIISKWHDKRLLLLQQTSLFDNKFKNIGIKKMSAKKFNVDHKYWE